MRSLKGHSVLLGEVPADEGAAAASDPLGMAVLLGEWKLEALHA